MEKEEWSCTKLTVTKVKLSKGKVSSDKLCHDGMEAEERRRNEGRNRDDLQTFISKP